MKRIRILHVAQAAGGVDRYIRMLLKYLDKDKFENVLVCSQDFHEEDYNGLVDYFEQIEMTRAIGASDLKATKAVRKLIKKYNPDIVYAHSSKAGAIARIADIGLKNYCIYNPHGWAFNMRCSAKKKAIYTMIEKIAAPFCDKIICISDAEKQSALDKKICKEDKLQVIFNGVDIEAYENGAHGAVKRQDLNIPEDTFVVGMVGSNKSAKSNQMFLLRMAKQVKDRNSKCTLIIVGNGNQEAEIRKYAEDNGFSNPVYYVDDGVSGTTFERDGFKAMMADVEAGKAGTIITKDLSRLGRDYLKTGEYIEIIFPDYDVRYIAINDNVDTLKSENELMDFKNIFNDWYARDTSKKIRAVFKAKGQSGKPLSLPITGTRHLRKISTSGSLMMSLQRLSAKYTALHQRLRSDSDSS